MSDPEHAPRAPEPRISVTLNIPASVYEEIEAYTRARWPEAKRAPRWIAVLRTGFELIKEVDARAPAEPSDAP